MTRRVTRYPRRRPVSPKGAQGGGAWVLLLGIAAAGSVFFGARQSETPSTPTPVPKPAAIQTLYAPSSAPGDAGIVHLPAPSISTALPRRQNIHRKPESAPSLRSQECGAGEYRNVDDLCIHRPYDTPHGGETAVCRDGSHSMSQHHRGTCSHHGGVAMWE